MLPILQRVIRFTYGLDETNYKTGIRDILKIFEERFKLNEDYRKLLLELMEELKGDK